MNRANTLWRPQDGTEPNKFNMVRNFCKGDRISTMWGNVSGETAGGGV